MPKNPRPNAPAIAREEWLATLRRLELIRLRYQTFSIECRAEPLLTLPPNKPALVFKRPIVRQAAGKEPAMVVAEVGVEASLKGDMDPDGTAPLVSARVVVHILYIQKPHAAPLMAFPDAFLANFQGQAFHHAWPFLREGVASLFERTGFTVPLLPMIIGTPAFVD